MAANKTIKVYVEGYWGGDKCIHGFIDNIGLDDYLEELHGCK